MSKVLKPTLITVQIINQQILLDTFNSKLYYSLCLGLVNQQRYPTTTVVLFWYTFNNTYFGKSIALFLLVLLTITIPHVG